MELLDKRAAAKYLGIHPDTLMSEVRSGRLLGFKIGYRWRFDRRDLDGYVDGRRREAAQAAQAARAPKRNMVSIRAGVPQHEVRAPVWIPGMKIQDVCAAAQGGKKG